MCLKILAQKSQGKAKNQRGIVSIPFSSASCISTEERYKRWEYCIRFYAVCHCQRARQTPKVSVIMYFYLYTASFFRAPFDRKEEKNPPPHQTQQPRKVPNETFLSVSVLEKENYEPPKWLHSSAVGSSCILRVRKGKWRTAA